jgi:tetratricopeptide (TPR) repeat protein
MSSSRIPAVTLFLLSVVLLSTGAALAQEWRGQGRVAGKVTDESGVPLEGVVITAVLPSSENRGPSPLKTNAKGEWSLGGISRGAWALDFSKEGYETLSISVPVSEGTRIPAMVLALKKKAVVVDPNVAIKEDLVKAAALLDAKQFAEARAIYERLAAQYPQVTQFRPLIARTYHEEGNSAKAIEALREAVAADPDNVEVRLLLGNILIEAGQDDEGHKVLASVDDAKVTDPTVYLNLGIAMINERKHAEAITWFDKVIARFPADPDAYYYRGISYLSLQKPAEAKADLQKYVSIAPADAPELVTAKKILETIK